MNTALPHLLRAELTTTTTDILGNEAAAHVVSLEAYEQTVASDHTLLTLFDEELQSIFTATFIKHNFRIFVWISITTLRMDTFRGFNMFNGISLGESVF